MVAHVATPSRASLGDGGGVGQMLPRSPRAPTATHKFSQTEIDSVLGDNHSPKVLMAGVRKAF
jgi:hypothetical protein